MLSSKKQTVLITGASGGIGLELAKLFAKDSYFCILVARSKTKLEELQTLLKRDYGADSHIVVKDLSQATAPQEIFNELEKQNIAVDILVNNAGYGLFGNFWETDLSQELDMIQLNITSLTHLTKLFQTQMIARKHGRILNVASTAAFQPGPLMAVYYATKAFVLSFSEAIAEELKPHGITVTCLCPGATSTGFQSKADMGDSRLFKTGVMDVVDVAKTGYRALMCGKTLAIPGLRNKVLAQSIRFTPRRLVPKIVKYVQARVT